MNVLVTGGAGYVGSHAVKHLVEHGHRPIIVDNLTRGHAEVASLLGVPLVVSDAGDVETMEELLARHSIDCVMHFAAFASVGESTTSPLMYYSNNVGVAVGLLEAMARAGVERFVFSSTCAVYGVPDRLPIRETTAKNPVSPYGRSKLMVEHILADHLRSRPGFSYAALRYFNASGAALDASIGEDHDPETHLIPLVLRSALKGGPALKVFGTNYPTPDGTAIRDYVHVEDLADAHERAMTRLQPGQGIECNLGTGSGFSVHQILDAAEQVTGRRIPRVESDRREGDPPSLFADAALAQQLLGWSARHTDPREIIRSAWNWTLKHPSGYTAA